VMIPPGYWLLIGVKGEPYSTTDEDFRSRYMVPEDTPAERAYWATITQQTSQESDTGCSDNQP